jgi:hypothetical protein
VISGAFKYNDCWKLFLLVRLPCVHCLSALSSKCRKLITRVYIVMVQDVGAGFCVYEFNLSRQAR